MFERSRESMNAEIAQLRKAVEEIRTLEARFGHLDDLQYREAVKRIIAEVPCES
jgi:hypothetical protein